MSGYYLLRPRTNDIFTSVFDKRNVVGVGWSEVDFSSCKDGADVHDMVFNNYYKGQPYYPSTVSKWCNQAERFKNINIGAKILVPLPYEVALAEAKSLAIYDSALGKSLDLANLHEVSYRRDSMGNVVRISRSRLSHGLQSRLRMMGSICVDLQDFGTEIDYLFQYGENAYDTAFSNCLNEKRDVMRQSLLENIQKGRTQLQAGGAGFEGLICALLQCMGYDNVSILPKNDLPAGCDADIIASRFDNILGEIKILVQAKHHSGLSGTDGINQLINALAHTKYSGKGYTGVFITSASQVDPTAASLAASHNIRILRGADIINMIFSNLDTLDPSIVSSLGIFIAPDLFSYQK